MNRININRKVIAFTVLIAYLSLFISNAYHYHNLNYVIDNSGQFDKSKPVKGFSHSLENCIVQTTFNSIHNSFVKNIKPETFLDTSISLQIKNLPLFRNSFTLNEIKLRAPPVKHS
ncbi:MAG: hypothetical protein NUV92_06970 [Ignavibacteria bacterium]|jgi:hypothetical protein|nr:hypothetical protein [Ignavibacteria bacterium]MDH7527367.1 hypothetical protein [Ignavibacteria bacterium]NPV12065.1 hypothetical protein [Ignavibacteria bacterium]